MAKQTQLQIVGQAGAFSGGDLAARELGIDTTNGRFYFSTDGSDIHAISPGNIGDIVWTASVDLPWNGLWCDGTAVSRTTYADLFNAITFTDSTVDVTFNSLTVTMDDTTGIYAGWNIEGTNIPTGTTIATIDSSTQISLNTVATGTATNITATFLPAGDGDGSTTFNLPNMQGRFPRGFDPSGSYDIWRGNLNFGYGTYEADTFKEHSHTIGNHDHVGARRGNQNAASGSNRYSATSATTTGNTIPTCSTEGGDETVPKNVAYPFYIIFK